MCNELRDKMVLALTSLPFKKQLACLLHLNPALYPALRVATVHLQIIRIFDSILAPKLADFDVEIKPLASHIAQATLRVRLQHAELGGKLGVISLCNLCLSPLCSRIVWHFASLRLKSSTTSFVLDCFYRCTKPLQKRSFQRRSSRTICSTCETSPRSSRVLCR